MTDVAKKPTKPKGAPRGGKKAPPAPMPMKPKGKASMKGC